MAQEDGFKYLDRFQGCLLGVALGDALGGLFEAQSSEGLRARFPSVEALMAYPREELWYTDDTQMTIGVAEALCGAGEIVEDRLCQAFVSNYVPSRGYGRGARVVLEAMEEGLDHRAIAAEHFPGGSYGNGAAMRVAPIGLFFHRDPVRVLEQARRSALPTHVHPLGIEGALLLARGVGYCVRAERFDREAYFSELRKTCTSDAFRERIEAAARVRGPEDLAALGNRIEALDSVPTALASFALTPDSFEQTIGQVILLGGDTDTLAAMAGALSGAYRGLEGLPTRLVNLLEDGLKGRKYLLELSRTLCAAAGMI